MIFGIELASILIPLGFSIFLSIRAYRTSRGGREIVYCWIVTACMAWLLYGPKPWNQIGLAITFLSGLVLQWTGYQNAWRRQPIAASDVRSTRRFRNRIMSDVDQPEAEV